EWTAFTSDFLGEGSEGMSYLAGRVKRVCVSPQQASLLVDSKRIYLRNIQFGTLFALLLVRAVGLPNEFSRRRLR
ncbi:hypothetical protein N9Y42_11210, partial [Mariniblastus sp.]|nr:hypothetical protein [Mariniblastus sp.]